MGVIQDYLEAKYGSGGPDSDRFDPEPGEVHSSRVSNCQRAYYYKFKRNHDSDPSPYFELGNTFEMLYGAALAHAHDDDVTPAVLNRHPPWEVSMKSRVVVRDLNVDIDLPGAGRIVGECDWVVLDRPVEAQPTLVELHADGSRSWVDEHGDGHDGDPPVSKVVETKTKGNIKWVKTGPDEKHVYQVYPYMRALGAPGEIAYMERDDWSEHICELELTEEKWLDVRVRAQRHVRNVQGDELPPTTPLNDKECKWCDFKDECEAEGGSIW